MHRRFAPVAVAAAVILAACGGGGGPAISDPTEIVTKGLEATSELESAHIALAVEGTANVAELGGEMDLSGTTFEGDFDLANESAHMTFAVPTMLGLSGEIIQIGQDSYVKTSLTGAMWMKSTATEEDPVTDALDPDQQLDQVRDFLDDEGVELEKLEDAECGDRTCYAVRLTIPAEVLAGAGEGSDMDPSEFVGEALVLELLFDRENLWLTEVSTEIADESIGELTLTITLSAFNDEVEVEAPPEDEVTEDGGEVFPF